MFVASHIADARSRADDCTSDSDDLGAPAALHYMQQADVRFAAVQRKAVDLVLAHGPPKADVAPCPDGAIIGTTPRASSATSAAGAVTTACRATARGVRRPASDAGPTVIAQFVSAMRPVIEKVETLAATWCETFGHDNVVSCFDWAGVYPRLSVIIPSLKSSYRDGASNSTWTLTYYALLARRHWATVDIHEPSPKPPAASASAAAAASPPIPSGDSSSTPWRDPCYRVTAADYSAMADKLDTILAGGGIVEHLVVVAQSPLQRYWSQFVPGMVDELCLDDTFGASRDASSFGTLMGYAPAWGLHIPVGFYVLMYKQGDRDAKTTALVWLLRHWRAMGNEAPRTLTFDADVASINAVAEDTITRLLKETASMLASSAGRGLLAGAERATESQRVCAGVVLDSLRCMDLDAAQRTVAKAYDTLLESSPSPQSPSAGDITALPMLAAHILQTPTTQPVAFGFARVLCDSLVSAAKQTARLVAERSKATVRCPQAAEAYCNALDDLVRSVRTGSSTAADALRAVHDAADAVLVYDLRVRFSDIQRHVLGSTHSRIAPILEPADSSFTNWCSRLFGLHVRVCEFHVRKAWNDNLAGHFSGDKARKQAALDALREMSMKLCTADFTRHWESFKTTYADKPALVNYVWNTWIDPATSQFAGLWEGYTRPFPHFLIDTTNPAEVRRWRTLLSKRIPRHSRVQCSSVQSFFAVFKYVICEGFRESSMRDAFEKVFGSPDDTVCTSQSHLSIVTHSQLLERANPDRSNRKGSVYVESRRKNTSEFFLRLVKKHIAVDTVPDDSLLAGFGLFSFRSGHGKRQTICLAAGWCGGCPMHSETCKHLMGFRLYWLSLRHRPLWLDRELDTVLPRSRFAYPIPNAPEPPTCLRQPGLLFRGTSAAARVVSSLEADTGAAAPAVAERPDIAIEVAASLAAPALVAPGPSAESLAVLTRYERLLEASRAKLKRLRKLLKIDPRADIAGTVGGHLLEAAESHEVLLEAALC